MEAAPYQRLAAQLRALIESGEWPPDYKVPSQAQLQATYGVGRGVVEHAVDVLRREGLLEGKRRARLTVAHAVGVRTLADPDADWPHRTEPRDRSRPRATGGLAVRLRVEEGRPVTRERFELLDPDGRPAMLLTTWRAGRARRHESFRVTVRTHRMTREEADVLGFPAETLALLVDRTRYDAAGGVVEVADLVMPADRWTVGIEPPPPS